MTEGRRPTQEQIDAATEYIKRRIEQSNLVSDECNELFEEAAMRIAEIMMKYHKSKIAKIHIFGGSACAREIQEAVDWLLDEIYNACLRHFPEELETDQDMRKKIMITLFEEEDHDATFFEREEYDRSLYLVGLASDDDIEDSTGMMYEDLVEHIMSLTSKAENRLRLLAMNTVALSFTTAAFLNAMSEGRSGFWVINGPNPCKFCASMEGFHGMSDQHPLYHVHCQCLTVYV